MKLFLLGILFLASQSAVADHALVGQYTESKDPSMRLAIDKFGYVSTNIIAIYGQYKLAHVFPHRLVSVGQDFEARGYMRMRWTLDGSDWSCDYPVNLLLSPIPGEENPPIDATLKSPGNIYIPNAVGSCPYGSMTDFLLSFRKN